MIDQKLGIITVHDINPSHSEEILTVTEQLNKLKVKYNLSIVPNYNKKYRLEDYMDFCKQISSLLKYGNIELTLHGFYHQIDGHIDLTLHGLYHQVDGKIEDFDTQSKEEEKQEIQEGLDILSAVNLPRPSMFITPAWHLSRQCIEALKELNFSMSESMTDIEFIQEGKKYILHPVMNWDQQGDKVKNKQALQQNKEMFYKRIFNVNGKTNGLFRMAIHPPHDPDGALQDQLEMIKYIKEKEGYQLIKYSDLPRIESTLDN